MKTWAIEVLHASSWPMVQREANEFLEELAIAGREVLSVTHQAGNEEECPSVMIVYKKEVEI